MGKANRKKIDLVETGEMVGLIQTLKDVAENKYYSLVAEKDKLRRFGETFVDFFRLVSLIDVEHPFVKNDVATTGIIVATGEGSFLGKLNGSILNLADRQMEKYKDFKLIAVGERGFSHLRSRNSDVKEFSGFDKVGLYQMSIDVKNYIVDEVLNGHLGRVVCVYGWSKTVDIQKSRVVTLLPCIDIVAKQVKFVDEFKEVIQESKTVDIVSMLSDIWVTSRIYEIFIDLTIASAATKVAFLDDSVDKMKKEEVKARISYRKAKKGDIDKSLRETFSARLIANKSV